MICSYYMQRKYMFTATIAHRGHMHYTALDILVCLEPTNVLSYKTVFYSNYVFAWYSAQQLFKRGEALEQFTSPT